MMALRADCSMCGGSGYAPGAAGLACRRCQGMGMEPPAGRRGNTWTEARIAKLMNLRAKGWSASKIAVHMGLTRNQVIGKCHRLGLSMPKDTRRPGRLAMLTRAAEPVE